jgi:hypothetical protein
MPPQYIGKNISDNIRVFLHAINTVPIVDPGLFLLDPISVCIQYFHYLLFLWI